MLLLHRNVYLLNGRACPIRRQGGTLISQFERIGRHRRRVAIRFLNLSRWSDTDFPTIANSFLASYAQRSKGQSDGASVGPVRRWRIIAGRPPIVGIALSARCIVFTSATSALSRGLSANSRAGKLSRGAQAVSRVYTVHSSALTGARCKIAIAPSVGGKISLFTRVHAGDAPAEGANDVEREREREREEKLRTRARGCCESEIAATILPHLRRSTTQRNVDLRLQSIREHAASLTSPLIGARYPKAETMAANVRRRLLRLIEMISDKPADDSVTRLMSGEICASDRTFATLKLPASAFSEFRFTRIAPMPRASYSSESSEHRWWAVFETRLWSRFWNLEGGQQTIARSLSFGTVMSWSFWNFKCFYRSVHIYAHKNVMWKRLIDFLLFAFYWARNLFTRLQQKFLN